MTPSEMKALIDIVQNINQSDLVNKVIDNSQGGYLVSVPGSTDFIPHGSNFKEIQTMFKNIFSDDSALPTAIDVEVLNGSGITGLGGKIADKLTAQGMNVTKIANNPELIDETIIYASSIGSANLAKIKALFNSPQIATLDDKGLIRVIIGRDYGNQTVSQRP